MLVDVLLTLVVAGVVSITISAASEPGSRPPDALAYGLGLLMAVPLLGRRRWPIGVLLTTVAVFTVYAQLDFPGFFPALPLAVPLYSASAERGLRWPVGVGTFFVGTTTSYGLLVGSEPVARVLNDTMVDGAFFASIILLGAVVRRRRLYNAEVAERIRRAEAESERVAQELRVAHLVQQQFLPAALPDLAGWKVAAFYRSAREVGGDFYTFAELPAGRLGIGIGDVTDKGAPAALIMASTQALLHTEAPRLASPSDVLKKLNEVLVPNTPEAMFVTCLYIVVDPATGGIQFANAGHSLPYLLTNGGVVDLWATGMPLGLMPDSTYELMDASMAPGNLLFLHTDGLAEAHNEKREMFGSPRIKQVMETSQGDALIEALITELESFTGPGWDQEDDITLVTLERLDS